MKAQELRAIAALHRRLASSALPGKTREWRLNLAKSFEESAQVLEEFESLNALRPAGGQRSKSSPEVPQTAAGQPDTGRLRSIFRRKRRDSGASDGAEQPACLK